MSQIQKVQDIDYSLQTSRSLTSIEEPQDQIAQIVNSKLDQDLKIVAKNREIQQHIKPKHPLRFIIYYILSIIIIGFVFFLYILINQAIYNDKLMQRTKEMLFKTKLRQQVTKMELLLVQIQEKQQAQQQQKRKLKLQQKQKERLRIQEFNKVCYKRDYFQRKVFFVKFDIEDMDKDQRQRFQSINGVCQFEVYADVAYNYFIDIWNQRQKQFRYDQAYINRTNYNRQEMRQLLIWLKLYFRAGIYLHPSYGFRFGKYLNDRYLIDAQVGKQIIFNEYDYKNQKGIYVPLRNFKSVRVDVRLSEYVRQIIKKIIVKQDWLNICQQNQCIIIKDSIK